MSITIYLTKVFAP